MTHYGLLNLYARICVIYERAATNPSPGVQAYLERAKHRLRSGITYNREWTPDYAQNERFRCIDNAGDGIRFVGKVDEIRMSGDGNLPYFDRAVINHTGWFTDPYRDVFEDGTGLCYGVVYQLPTRRKTNGFVFGRKYDPDSTVKWQYVPGCQNGAEQDGSPVLDFHSITSDIKQAIRTADQMAERYSESEREYQAKYLAETRIEEGDAEIKDIRKTMHGLFAELKAHREDGANTPHIRTAVCAQIRTHRSRIKKLIREKLRLQDDFWNAVPEQYRY